MFSAVDLLFCTLYAKHWNLLETRPLHILFVPLQFLPYGRAASGIGSRLFTSQQNFRIYSANQTPVLSVSRSWGSGYLLFFAAKGQGCPHRTGWKFFCWLPEKSCLFNSFYYGMYLFDGTLPSHAKRAAKSFSQKIFRDIKKQQSPETAQLFPAGNCLIVTFRCLRHNIVPTLRRSCLELESYHRQGKATDA